MTMIVGVIGGVIAAIAAISGMLLGWKARERTQKQDARADGCADGVLQADVNYIKRGVDDIRLDMKDQNRKLDVLSERVTRVEESSKQAHKRLDHIERKEE